MIRVQLHDDNRSNKNLAVKDNQQHINALQKLILIINTREKTQSGQM